MSCGAFNPRFLAKIRRSKAYSNRLKFLGGTNQIEFRAAGNDLTDYFYIRSADATVVPVPAAIWLFGSGLIGLVGIARRKKS